MGSFPTDDRFTELATRSGGSRGSVANDLPAKDLFSVLELDA